MSRIQAHRQQRSPQRLTELIIPSATRSSSVMFLFFPEWARHMPPYNMARLVSVTRAAGYRTVAIDVNALAYTEMQQACPHNQFWHPAYSWRWHGEHYFQHLHPHLEPILERLFLRIEQEQITVLACTLYYCNQTVVEWFTTEAKRRFPHLRVIIGGPMAQHSFWKASKDFDIIVSGEGEELILQALDQIEQGHIKSRWLRQADGERIDLDRLPSPDYSWCDFDQYEMPNGVCMEFSRGCIAKCTFCQETHFWKYRNRRSESVVSDIEQLYHNKGINVIWFLDSLVNGDLKELELFCDLIIAKGLKIKWTGYARCDRRMDRQYFEKLAASGCFALSFGIESGSDKVLSDMGKGITREIIESNLELSKLVGIDASTNWIVGFPTETIQDFYETLILLKRQYQNIDYIGNGQGFAESGETIVGQNFDRFNLLHAKFENKFITKDYTNSKPHRLMRMKLFIALMDILGKREGNRVDFYSVKFKNNFNNVVDYENWNFNVITPNINPLADSFINEIFSLMRLLYRWKGAFEFQLNFDRKQDSDTYGERLAEMDLDGTIKFDINLFGNFTVKYDLKFTQSKNNWHGHYLTHADSLAAARARKLAKNNYDDTDLSLIESKKNQIDQDARERFADIDFSFDYRSEFTGKWDTVLPKKAKRNKIIGNGN